MLLKSIFVGPEMTMVHCDQQLNDTKKMRILGEWRSKGLSSHVPPLLHFPQSVANFSHFRLRLNESTVQKKIKTSMKSNGRRPFSGSGN